MEHWGFAWEENLGTPWRQIGTGNAAEQEEIQVNSNTAEIHHHKIHKYSLSAPSPE